MSHVCPEIDRASEVGLTLGLDLREDIGGVVVELWTAKQGARKIGRGPGQPAILGDVDEYRDFLPCRVMTCGRSLVTARIISLKRCLASWICQ